MAWATTAMKAGNRISFCGAVKTKLKFAFECRSTRDYAMTFAASFVVLLAQFFIYKLSAAMLGNIGFSEFAVAKRTVASIEPALMLGLSIALPRFLASAGARAGCEQAALRYYSASAFCMLLMTGAAVLLLVAFRRRFAYLVFGRERFAPLITAIALMLLGVGLHNLAYSYFRGQMAMARANLLQICNLAIVPVLALSMSSSAYTALMGTAAACIVIAGFSLLQTPIRKFDWHFRREICELLRYGVQRVPGDFMYVALLMLPAVFCVHLRGIEGGGRIAFGISIAVTMGSLFSPISVVLLPKASRMITQGDMLQLRAHVVKLAVAAAAISTLIVCGVELIALPLVRAYLGPGFTGVGVIVREIMPAAIPIAMMTILRGVIDAYYSNAVVTLNVGFGMATFLVVAGIGFHLKSQPTIIAALLLGLSVITVSSAYCVFRIFKRLTVARVVAGEAAACTALAQLHHESSNSHCE
jgi:O-antigen/teichoic acid export membrane protein